VQNFTSIGAEAASVAAAAAPKDIKNFHFLVKSRPARATPLTDFANFRVIRITGYGVIAEKPRVGKLGQIFPYTL